jgi:hypothetical protein
MTITPAEANKAYRQRNPERWLASLTKYQKAKWKCDCGAVVCNQVRPRHLKSKKHLERMELIDETKKSMLEETTESESDTE